MTIKTVLISIVLMFGCLIQARAQMQTQYDKGTPPQFAAGVSSLGSYMSTEFGTINLSNGSLNFNIPVGRIGGRGNFDMPLVLSYSSKVWSASKDVDTDRESQTEQSVAFADYDNQNSFAGASTPGWSLRAGMYLSRKFVKIGRIMSGPSEGCYTYGLHKLTLNLPDKGEVEFRDDATNGAPLPLNCSTQQTASRGTRWHATDGSGAIFINDVDNGVGLFPIYNLSGTLILADGTCFGSTTNGHIVDRNGNRLSGTLNGWMDQLGRTTTIEYGVQDPDDPSVTLAMLITIPGYQGTPRYYKIKTGIMSQNYRSDINPTLPVITGDWDPEGWGYDWWGPHTNLFSRSYGLYAQRLDDREVLTEIVLPDGRSLKFRYNEFGEVAEVELPTGGKIQYDYAYRALLPTGNSPSWETQTTGFDRSGVSTDVKQVDRAVIAKRTYPDGVNLESTWQFGYGSHSIDGVTYPATAVIVTSNTSALLSKQRHLFLQKGRYTEPYGGQSVHDGTHYTLWSTGVEWRVEVLNASDTVLSANEKDWSQRAPVSWSSYPQEQPANDNRVNQARRYLENGMMAKTEATYDQYNNPIEVREYDFDQSLKRRTTTSYLSWNNGFNYQTDDSIHMLSLPVTTTVYNGAGTQVARTTNEYDVYATDGNHALLTSYSNVSQHDSINYGISKITRGNVTRVGHWLNTTGTFIYSYFRFDVLGNVVSTKDANGNVTTVDFADDFGPGQNPGNQTKNPATPTYALPTLITSPPPLPGAPVHTARSQYDYSTGLLTGFRDRNNTVTQTIYNDPFNRPTQVKAAVGVTEVEAHTSMYYAPTTAFGVTLSRNDTLTESDLNTVDDGSLRSWTVTDGFGRTTEAWTRDPQGDVKVSTIYDGLGRVKQVSNPFRPSTESPAYTTTAYDLIGRTTSVTTPDNAAVITSYDANTVTVTDEAGKSRKSVTDGLGRLVGVYEDPNGLALLTSYTYDTLDNLVKVTQDSQQRFFMYDSLKRLIRARNPEQGTHAILNLSDSVTGNNAWSTGYQYDSNNNLIEKTDARGVMSTYAYDAFNRNTTVDYSDTGSINPDVKRFYDGATNGNGRFWYQYSGGDFSTGSNVEHTAVDSYDALGRPLVRRQLFKLNGTWSGTYQMSRGYNRAGAVTSQTYPSGHSITYNYNSAGRLADNDALNPAFTGNLGDGVQRTYASGNLYNAWGSLTIERFGTETALYHKLQYNIRGQLWDVRVATGSDVNGSWNRGALQMFYEPTYTHGASGPTNNGNVLKTNHYVPLDESSSTVAIHDQFYNYDPLNRLLSVAEYFVSSAQPLTQQSLQSYTYDRYGNRTINASQTWGTGINSKQFTVDPAGTNRLTVPSGQSGVMNYDNAGNLTMDTYSGAGVRTYDAENRMTTAADNMGHSSRYTYDADGSRTRRQVGGGEEVWQIYGFDGELLAEYAANSSASAVQREYGYRNGQLLVTAEPASAVNVALAANGAVATASSAYDPAVCGSGAVAANDGDRTGRARCSHHVWNDAAPANTFPDSLQIDFNGSKTIKEIDVVTVQDHLEWPVEPTESMTFSQYGLTAYQVQYWNNSTWVTIPGGSVSGNNKVWRKFTFSAITTTKIRVLASASPDGYSRLAELEAWTGPSPAPRYDLALGATATASTSYPGWVPSAVVNGDRKSLNAYSNGAWSSSAANNFPEWVLVDFGTNQTINEIDVFTLQDNWANSVEPTAAMTFTLYGLTGYEVQYWTGSGWVTVPGGSVTGNNKIWKTFTFSPISTSKIRVLTNAAPDGVSRITEIEAYGPAESSGSANVRWLVPDHLGTPRIVLDQTGNLAGVKRHDYLPFGEELFAGTGGRTVGMGYAADGVRQQFTQKERDVETGLDYFGARYYSNTQGRFTSVDPQQLKRRHLKDPRDLNRYAYVANNPLKYVDPDGMEKIIVIVRSYIPYETITHPPGVGATFNGDFNSKGERISYKTEQRITIETESRKPNSNGILEYSQGVGKTIRLARGVGSWRPPSEGQADGKTLDKSFERINENSVRVTAKGNESNPLIPASPGITYNLAITVSSNGGDGKATVNVYGQHDGFPAYEVEIQRPESGGTSTIVYQHDPRKTGEGPQSLYGSGEHSPRTPNIPIEPKKKDKP